MNITDDLSNIVLTFENVIEKEYSPKLTIENYKENSLEKIRGNTWPSFIWHVNW